MSAIPIDHPDLNSPIPDYSAVHFKDDGSPFITDRYHNLSPSTQRYVLALARIGQLDLAQRVAMCCRSGHVSKRCKRGKYAMAHRHHCGDHFCALDSSGSYRFHKWMTKRDHNLLHLPHEGLEIRFRNHKSCLDTHNKKMLALRMASNALLSKLTPNSISVVAFSERIADDSIRVLFPGKGHSYNQIKKILEGLGFDNLVAVVKRGTTEELFHWAFNGFYDLAIMDADAKAALRVELIGCHTITTTGTLYAALSPEEWRRADAEPQTCPICKDHDLEVLPIDDRHSQSVDDINDTYEHVDWAANLSPFLVRKDAITNKSKPRCGKSPNRISLDCSALKW